MVGGGVLGGGGVDTNVIMGNSIGGGGVGGICGGGVGGGGVINSSGYVVSSGGLKWQLGGQSDKQEAVEWLLKSYSIYVDGHLKCVVESQDRTKALLEKIDLTKVKRGEIRKKEVEKW